MQVMASQKQIEVKYQQAQKTAVRPSLNSLHGVLPPRRHADAHFHVGSLHEGVKGAGILESQAADGDE